jgi:hypothetical protein
LHGGTAPCTAPAPGVPPRIFAGVESTLPLVEGNLRLTGYSVDDRLSSPGPRAIVWGRAGRLLTVEIDRATIWTLPSGVASRALALPPGVILVEAAVASSDLAFAACVVRTERANDEFATELLFLDLSSGVSKFFGLKDRPTVPFALSDDGKTLVAGSDLWDVPSLAHVRTAFTDDFWHGERLSHPRWVDPTSQLVAFPGRNYVPMAGPARYQRLLAFGPRLLEYVEATEDVSADVHSARTWPSPGYVSTSTFDGAPPVRFDVPDVSSAVVLSANGRWVGTLARTFTLRSADSPRAITELADTGWANRAQISDDGRVLVLGYVRPERSEEQAGGGNTPAASPPKLRPRLEAWDLTSGARLYRASEAFQAKGRLTADGRYLWEPGRADVLDFRRGRRLWLPSGVASVSPEGMALLGDDWGGTTVVDLAAEHVVLSPKRRSVVVAVSRDFTHIATRAPDQSLQLEGPGRCARVVGADPQGRPAFIDDSVRFSDDSSTLVAHRYGFGFSLSAWDAATGLERYALQPERAEIQLPTPLREIYVVSTEPSPTSLLARETLSLDVRTGDPLGSFLLPVKAAEPQFISAGLELAGPITASRLSDDGTIRVVASFDGALVVRDERTGSVLGHVDFGPRHDRVRVVWFEGPGRFSVQTARGAEFGFAFAPAS